MSHPIEMLRLEKFFLFFFPFGVHFQKRVFVLSEWENECVYTCIWESCHVAFFHRCMLDKSVLLIQHCQSHKNETRYSKLKVNERIIHHKSGHTYIACIEIEIVDLMWWGCKKIYRTTCWQCRRIESQTCWRLMNLIVMNTKISRR